MRYSTELTVDLSLLGQNIDLLREKAPKNKIIFMVKADAYGHGIIEIVNYACSVKKIMAFGCATLGEAIRVRKELPGLECELYVFSDTELDVENLKSKYLKYDIKPVIHSLEDLAVVLADSNFKNFPLVIKIDSGMNRLGITNGEIESLVTLMHQNGRKTIDHLLTHFASSYIKLKSGGRTDQQINIFTNIKKKIIENAINIKSSSCSNSGAIEQQIGLDETHIRPGLMLYGPQSTLSEDRIWRGSNISKFKTKIIKLLKVKKGTPVGYGGHICPADGYIAYLPVGYGDGVLTFYSGAKLKFHDINCQILGRVNMDITAIFVTDNHALLQKGEEFIFWDHKEHSISELSARLRTIPYQLFTALTARVPRKYLK